MTKPKPISNATAVATIETELVVDSHESARVDRILAADQGVKRAFKHQVGYAFIAGLELLEQKALSGHGHFLKWCKENLASRGLSDRSARRYMQFAEALQPQFASVANFDLPQLRETNNGALPDSALDTISEAIREVANGATFKDLYRDLGLIPDKKKQKHAPAKITPEETEAALNAAANELYKQVTNALLTLADDDDAQRRATPDVRKALKSACVTANKREALFLKSEKASRAGHKKNKAKKAK